MWSCRLSKIKKSIANSTALAEAQRDNSTIPSINNRNNLYSFTKRGRWQYLIELFLVSTLLSLILILAKAGTWQNLQLGQLAQYIFFIQWVVLCFTALVDTWQNQFRQLSHFYALLFGFLLLQCIVLLSTFSLNVLNYWGSHLSWTGIDSDILFKDIGLNLSFGILMGVIFLRYLYMREQWFRQQSSGLNARIQAMQARIHPHFLFNSINSVVSLISTDPDRAETMLISLSKLFRASLQDLKLVSLQQEIDLCRHYLSIEQMRLGERLQVEWKIENTHSLNQVYIPLLTLQPLIENSIFHGVESVYTQGTIGILVEILQNQVTIVITNPYSLDKITLRKGHGIAIQSVRERLQAYFGQSVQFQTFAGEGIYTTIVQYHYK